MRISNIIWRYNYSGMKGKFIVLEGLDRCGKSSMTKFLQEKCSGEGQENKAVVINFPNRKSAIGTMINDFLLNKADIGNEAIHLLFSANRWEAMKDIERTLKEGKNIICDRYWYSGVAYSFAKGLDFEWCVKPDIGLVQPDLVIVLKGDPHKLSTRQGYGNERFEKVEFQQKVAEGFQKIVTTLQKSYIKVINVDNKSLPQVKDQVFRLVDQHFGNPSQ